MTDSPSVSNPQPISSRHASPSGIIRIEGGDYQSVNGYARERGVSRTAVLKQIWAGRLDAVQVGRAWIVRVNALQI